MPDDLSSSSSESPEEEEVLEVLQGIPWPYHPVRKFLLEKLIADEIPGDYRKMGAQFVWNKYCDLDIFEGMEYDEASSAGFAFFVSSFLKGRTGLMMISKLS